MTFKKALKWIFAFLTLTCVTGRNSEQNASPCDREAGSLDESIYVLQPFRKDVESTNNCTDGNKYVNLIDHNERCCPCNNRDVSGCQKAFKLNYNPNRKPHSVAEAYCLCDRSLKNGKNTTDKCKVIYNYRVVLFKKKGKKGKGRNGKTGKNEERTVRRVRAFGVDCVKDEAIARSSGSRKMVD